MCGVKQSLNPSKKANSNSDAVQAVSSSVTGLS